MLAGAIGLGNAARGNALGGSAACTWPPAQTVNALAPGVVAAMDSTPFTWSPGWQVSAEGADPPEPADPQAEPAGVLTFPYTGENLYLLLRPGDYWAYLYVTVDGEPANRLPAIAGNDDSRGLPGGYRTLLAPERPAQADPLPVLVHAGGETGEHTARVELWRGWGQTPLAGVAVDPAAGAGCAAAPLWPWVLAGALGVWGIGLGGWATSFQEGAMGVSSGVDSGGPFQEGSAASYFLEGAGVTSPGNNFHGPFLEGIALPTPNSLLAPAAAGLGLGLVVASVALGAWFLCAPGLLLLGLAGVLRPALWLGALLFGLPFAYGVKLPLLPGRAFDLIDLGVWGGVVVLLGHWLLLRWGGRLPGGGSLPAGGEAPRRAPGAIHWPLLALAAVTTWALVSAAAANYPGLALREWRVVFLNALLFGGLLALTFALSPAPGRDRWLLVTGWLAGGALISLFGLWGYVTGNEWVSQAEGVRRVQAFYGSGNNLALYLDRALAVALALALFTPRRVGMNGQDLQEAPPEASPPRWLWVLLATPMALAWLLTFSKGSLLLAAPAMALVLLAGGGSLLRREGRSLRPLWLLGGLGGLALLALTPFLGTERFQRLLDFGGGTGFLRLQLWRSAWQMALDHPLLGVGPDNFLYAYRSGYLLPAAWQEPNLNHPHTLLLDWFTRLGLPGLLLGLAWLGSGVFAAVRWLRDGPERALALGVLAACAAGLAHGLIDVSYALPDLMIVWVLLFGLAPRAFRGRDA